MKPRTKLQHRVLNLSLNHVLGITKQQQQWAYKTCLEHKGFANKTSAFCLDCGETFGLELIKRNRATCPSCGTKIKIEKTKKRTDKQHTFFAIADVVQEFQVIRNFELIAYYKKGKPVKYFLQSILEDWILPNLKVQKIGLQHINNWGADSWTGNWEIRQENGNYWNINKYTVFPRMYHPDSIFKAEYRKFGINKNLDVLTVFEAIKLVPSNPKAETLLKAKQYSLLHKCLERPGDISHHWPSIKICIRNSYKVKDAGIYIDYLDLLRYFHKDLRNAKYVCPKNLKQAHDKLVAKKLAIQKRQELQIKRKRAAQAQKQYEKLKAAFFGLQFTDGMITVKVLENVQEFLEEGDALKHCVFASEYYSKEDSLILSARIGDKPIETIEVCLSKMKIVQSRGLQNKATEYNKRIVKLVNNNLKTIESIFTKKKSLNQLLAS